MPKKSNIQKKMEPSIPDLRNLTFLTLKSPTISLFP